MPKDLTTQRNRAVIPTATLVASATRLPGNKVPRVYVKNTTWQREAYRHYAICGEARFAANFFGNAVAKATLYAEQYGPDGPTREPDSDAQALLANLFSSADGQTGMLQAIGVHLTIAGECYLVGRNVDEMGAPYTARSTGTQQEMWEIVSVMEMEVEGQKWVIDYRDGRKVNLTADDVVIRIWTPQPGNKMQADSPFKSLLPILSEIEWLTRHIFAQIRSRLAGAGILLLSQGMTFPPPPDHAPAVGEPKEPDNDADAFMLTLADGMMTPLNDPDDVSSMVPIVALVPDDGTPLADKAHLLTFWTELQSEAKDMRQEAIRRFAAGMDLEPEMVLGMSSNRGTGGGTSNGVSHWGAWQIEEQTIKIHIESKLDVIVRALTVSYLRPLLTGDVTLWCYNYDTTSLRLRPDRSKESLELYDRGLVAGSVVRRENRFNEDDAMGDDERRIWLTVKVATGSATPEQVSAALGMLGVAVPAPPTAGTAPPELPPPPSIADHPIRPRTPAEAPLALIAACDAQVYRALERAGNRLRQQGLKPPVPSWQTHEHVKANGTTDKVLADAWTCTDEILDGLGDPTVIIPVLQSYVVTLMTEQSRHTRARLADWLELAGVV